MLVRTAPGEHRRDQAGALHGDLEAGRPAARRRRRPTSTTISPCRTATRSPTTSGRRIRATARRRVAPRACSSPRASTAARSAPSGFIPGLFGRRRVAAGAARVQPVRSVRLPRGSRQSAGPEHSRVQLAAACNYTGIAGSRARSGSVQDITEKTWSLFLAHAFRHRTRRQAVPLQRGHSPRATRMSPPRASAACRSQLTLSPADPTLLTTTFSRHSADHDRQRLLLPAAQHGHEAGADGRGAAALRRLANADAAGDQLPDAGAQRGFAAAHRRVDRQRRQSRRSSRISRTTSTSRWSGTTRSNSYASVDAFVKDVTNFIVQGTQRQTINDVIDPTTGQPAIYTVSQRVNGPDATVNGWEIAWQHVFGDTGFGFNANATFVDTDKPYDRTDISQSGFAVTGLADSANLVGVLRQVRLRGARRGELARRVPVAVRSEPEQLGVRCRADVRELEPADRLLARATRSPRSSTCTSRR